MGRAYPSKELLEAAEKAQTSWRPPVQEDGRNIETDNMPTPDIKPRIPFDQQLIDERQQELGELMDGYRTRKEREKLVRERVAEAMERAGVGVDEVVSDPQVNGVNMASVNLQEVKIPSKPPKTATQSSTERLTEDNLNLLVRLRDLLLQGQHKRQHRAQQRILIEELNSGGMSFQEMSKQLERLGYKISHVSLWKKVRRRAEWQ